LGFLKKEKFELKDSVSALKKLAGLNKGHSFFSSHPTQTNGLKDYRLNLKAGHYQ